VEAGVAGGLRAGHQVLVIERKKEITVACPIAQGIREGKIDPEGEIHNALINLYMAADSDYFVGALGSSWARLVLMLSLGKYNCLQPHRTLGTRWASKWEFAMCSGKEFDEVAAKNMCRVPGGAGKGRKQLL